MKWEGQEQSRNVEDRRGAGGGGPRIGGRGIGIGTVVVALLAGWVFGINPLTVLGLLSGGDTAPAVSQGPARPPPAEDRAAAFASTVLRDTEQVWGRIFQAAGGSYREPRMVLFRGVTPTACGTGQSAMGPFYCPGDDRLYFDLDFFDTLARGMGAPGDFAQAYVIAHEVGHHVQNMTGTMRRFESEAQRLDERRRNALSIRLELQADCYAGVWGHFAQRRNLLEPGDLEEGMRAAGAVGDDTIMKRTQGYVVPDAMNHGTAEQRMRWFRVGLASGDPRKCDTFSVAQP